MFSIKLLKLLGCHNLRQYHTNSILPTARKGIKYDIAVLGGGIVGVASARELKLRHPDLTVAVIEKESRLAVHQSGHNSGVIHAGIYYKPGSLKAKLCVQGMNLAYEYLDKKGIPYKKCGKLIVAIKKEDIKPLEELYQRGLANNVPDLEMVDGDQIFKIEPHCKGLQALWSPHTGIVDWGMVTNSYGNDFKAEGGDIHFNFKVDKFKQSANPDYPVVICSDRGEDVRAKFVLACCGLQSDVVAVMSGCSPDPKIVPFRGEYLKLVPNKSHLAHGNIYPVPDARFPFLGVHFTPAMDGSILLGPNALLAFEREGYKWSDFNFKEMLDVVSYSGFRKMAVKYAAFGLNEAICSWIRPFQVSKLRKYVPELNDFDVMDGPSGVRAQAMGPDGTLIEDFVFDCQRDKGVVGSRVLHCRNAPSPGATSSLAIAKMIADKMQTEFNL